MVTFIRIKVKIRSLQEWDLEYSNH